MVLNISSPARVLVLDADEYSALSSLLYELSDNPDALADLALGSNQVAVLIRLWGDMRSNRFVV